MENELTINEIQLTNEDTAIVETYENALDFNDSTAIINYGADAQKRLSDFSDAALEGVKTKDLSGVSDLITDLVTEIKGFDVDDENKGLFSFLKKKGNELANLKNRFDTVNNNVEKVVIALENHEDTLTKDIVMLDEMYAANLQYFKDINLYIIAGKEKLEEARTKTLVELQNIANESGLPEDAQKASDFAAQCERLEKRLADLEITKTISLQMAPQIRLIQNSDNLMIEKIQTTINNTLPLWKNQMVLALGLAHSQQALEAQKAVTETTNELLKKNAEKLHQGSVEIAKASEESIVDIEVVKQTNEELLASLDEILAIQQEGHEKRVAAEAELSGIESQLKNKLLAAAKSVQEN